MAEFRAGLRGEIAELRIEFRTDLQQVRTELLRWMFGFGSVPSSESPACSSRSARANSGRPARSFLSSNSAAKHVEEPTRKRQGGTFEIVSYKE